MSLFYRSCFVFQFKVVNVIKLRTIVMDSKSKLGPRTVLKEMFDASVQSVLPHKIIENKLQIQDKQLHIDGKTFALNDSVYLVGFGKGVMGMAIALERKMREVLKKGIVSVPRGSKTKMTEIFGEDYQTDSVIEYCEGGHNNQPDEATLENTDKIIAMMSSLTDKDTLIVLVSGGGSALLCKPHPSITLQIKQQFCKSLQDAGANISELNTVRTKLSEVKGGGLIRMAYPVPVISLILSDIVNDPIQLIASGPTVYSKTSSDEVESILRKFNLYDSLSSTMKEILTSDRNLEQHEDEQNHSISNIVVGNNTTALEAAEKQALKKELHPVILRNDVVGDVHSVSLAYIEVVDFICQILEGNRTETEFVESLGTNEVLSLPEIEAKKIYECVKSLGPVGVVLIGGGEPTVQVTGTGTGGRNQELALRFSIDWKERIKSQPMLRKYDVMFLSAGTDGQDGPTDAAGAFGYPEIYYIFRLLKETLRKVQKSILKGVDREIDFDALNMYKEFFRLVDLNGSYKNVEADTSSTEEYCYDEEFLKKLQQQIDELNPEEILLNNDSYSFYSRFKKGQDLLKTGMTGTNVMDVHFIYIKKRDCGCSVDSEDMEASKNPFTEHDLSFDMKDDKNGEKIDSTKRELPKIKVVDRSFEKCDC